MHTINRSAKLCKKAALFTLQTYVMEHVIICIHLHVGNTGCGPAGSGERDPAGRSV